MKNYFNLMIVHLFRIPWIKERWSKNFNALEFDSVPWTPLNAPLSQCKISLLTTGGVHLKTDTPFNMEDNNGDASFRRIPSSATQQELTITHDYYDHGDADKDINLVLPIDILRDVQEAGLVGESASYFYSFMGHIDQEHVETLRKQTAPQVAQELKDEQVDIALLVPA